MTIFVTCRYLFFCGVLPLIFVLLEQIVASGFSYDYNDYQPYWKIKKELHRLARENAKEYSVFSLGTTFEGRDVWAFQISASKGGKTIVIDCGAHAREWIAPATCMSIINKLTKKRNTKHVNVKFLLKKFSWVFVPVFNPDGYAYTWINSTTRLWRKNRSYTKKQLKLRNERHNEKCIGVDINRNFGEAHWGGPGAPVNDPCYEMYAGAKPFSEKESKAMAKYLKTIKDDVIAYLSLHNFGQVWTTPWGYTKKKPSSFAEMERVAELATGEMKKKYGIDYWVGPSYDGIYPNSGSSTDWAYSELKIKYPYLIEMRPKQESNESFLMTAETMRKNVKEILLGISVMAKNMKT